MVASGLAGPRRAYAGSIRDFVLGVKLLNGRAEVLQFGGRVIKNVAGFDVSRIMVGALGTLGIILEVSLRVIPVFETETTLSFEQSADQHIRWVNELGSKPYPLSASLWLDGLGQIRLSGSDQGVRQAAQQLGGDQSKGNWAALKEQQHEFFADAEPLTRVALPPACDDLLKGKNQLIEWGGAQRWLCGETDIDELRRLVQARQGTVCAFRNHPADVAVFDPLAEAVFKLQRNLKSSFDPAGIFNPGRLYPGL
jgi:glycolate oxidase FAD binding subunit